MCICGHCAARGRSCCQARDIVLTAGDIQRVSEYTGGRDFYEWRRPQATAYLEQDDDPNWNNYTVNAAGCRRVIRHSRSEDCFFLTSQGCRLPWEIRPLLCRLHPVEFTEYRITGLAAECPVELLAPGESLLDNLRMNAFDIELLRAMLYEELREESHTFLPKAA